MFMTMTSFQINNFFSIPLAKFYQIQDVIAANTSPYATNLVTILIGGIKFLELAGNKILCSEP